MAELVQNKLLSLLRIGRGVLVFPFCSEEDASNIHPCEEVFHIVNQFQFHKRPQPHRMIMWDFTDIVSLHTQTGYVGHHNIVALRESRYKTDEHGELQLVNNDIMIHTLNNTYGPFCAILEDGEFEIRCPESIVPHLTPRQAYLHHIAHPLRFPKIPQHIIDEYTRDYPLDTLVNMLNQVTKWRIPFDKLPAHYHQMHNMFPERISTNIPYFQTLLALYMYNTTFPDDFITSFIKSNIDACLNIKIPQY
jgi:hypothetical protein